MPDNGDRQSIDRQPGHFTGSRATGDDFTKYGFGCISSLVIEAWWARCAFFAATEEVAKNELVKLRDGCLPIYREALAQGERAGLGRGDIPATVMTEEAAGNRRSRLCLIDSWNDLLSASQHDALMRRLKGALWEWAERHNVTPSYFAQKDTWMLDAVLRIIAGWSSDPQAAAKVHWSYPRNASRSPRGLIISGVGLPNFVHMALTAPRGYDPVTENRTDYKNYIEKYCERSEEELIAAGMKRVKRLRPGRGKEPLRDFKNLVLFQICRRSLGQLGPLDRQPNISTDIHAAARMVGLKVRK